MNNRHGSAGRLDRLLKVY